MPDKPPTPPPGTLIMAKPESVAVAQALYNVVTGKTEKLARAYTKNYLIKAEDLRQLHMKCMQTCNQWTVLNKSANVTVHHVDDNKEVFSSLKRFEIYDSSRTSPVESVVYELNILLTIPHSEKPQNYKVTVRCLSRIAMIKRMEDGAPPPQFLRFFGGAAILVEIDYVDYVIARNIISMIDSWASEVEELNTWEWMRPIKSVSHWIPNVLYILSVGALALTLFSFSSDALSEPSSNADLAKWMIIVVGSLLVVGSVARLIGQSVERSVDSVMEISAIILNKGDEKLLSKTKRTNIFTLVKGGVGILFVTAQGLVANSALSWVVEWFKEKG